MSVLSNEIGNLYEKKKKGPENLMEECSSDEFQHNETEERENIYIDTEKVHHGRSTYEKENRSSVVEHLIDFEAKIAEHNEEDFTCIEKHNTSRNNTACFSENNVSRQPDIKNEIYKKCNQLIRYENHSAFTSEEKDTCTDVSDFSTLGNVLRDFSVSFEELEKSLEDLRSHRKSKEEHELCFKTFDKKLQKLSVEYHLDKNSGSSQEKIRDSSKIQTALNITRSVLQFLNSVFLEDLDNDHKYGFYSELKISSLGNEEEVENHVHDVLFKISFMSKIKREYIIAEICKFLEKSQNCINSYIADNAVDFHMYCHSALRHFQKCIEGYDKLLKEINAVEKDFDDAENSKSIIENMKIESLKQLKILKKLREVSASSFRGKLMLFKDFDPADKYFVLPFIQYINLILMCNIMINNETKSIYSRMWNYFHNSVISCIAPCLLLSYPNSKIKGSETLFEKAYRLASDYSSVKHCDKPLRDMWKNEFKENLKQLKNSLEDEFKIDNYSNREKNKSTMEELNNCLRKEQSFQEEAEKLLKNMEESERDIQKVKEELSKMCQQALM